MNDMVEEEQIVDAYETPSNYFFILFELFLVEHNDNVSEHSHHFNDVDNYKIRDCLELFLHTSLMFSYLLVFES